MVVEKGLWTDGRTDEWTERHEGTIMSFLFAYMLGRKNMQICKKSIKFAKIYSRDAINFHFLKPAESSGLRVEKNAYTGCVRIINENILDLQPRVVFQRVARWCNWR